MASEAGKGSKQRPQQVSNEEYAQRWDLIFAREEPEESITRPVFFSVSCGVGMHYTHVYDMKGVSDAIISDTAYTLAQECAESFGDYVDTETYYTMLENDEDMGRVFCSEDLEYYWEDYDPVEHDCQRQGGGSFQEDIASW